MPVTRLYFVTRGVLIWYCDLVLQATGVIHLYGAVRPEVKAATNASFQASPVENQGIFHVIALVSHYCNNEILPCRICLKSVIDEAPYYRFLRILKNRNICVQPCQIICGIQAKGLFLRLTSTVQPRALIMV